LTQFHPKLRFLKKILIDGTMLWSNSFFHGTHSRSNRFAERTKADQERPMNYPIRMLPVAIVAAAALQLSSVSIASAQQYLTGPGTQQRTRTMAPNIGPNGYYATQSTARAAHPITQGGTTGGTVNPGLTRDHMQHGYNG
jgi:hypothetical protein